MSGKSSPKLLDHTKQSATDALKTSSRRVIQKAAEATGDLIGNKKIYKISKKFTSKWFRDRYKWLRKEIYLQKKDIEVLIIWDEL